MDRVPGTLQSCANSVVAHYQKSSPRLLRLYRIGGLETKWLLV